MPVYGFKANNRDDQLAITNLLLQSDNVQTRDYSTLAQYEIKDVQLKPRDVRPNQPRRWSLAVNTNLLGFNDPQGNALWFNDEKRPIGDGYVTYDIPAKAFAQMIQAGLYLNPDEYMRKLASQMEKENFYRRTRVSLMQFVLPDDHLQIAVGDVRMKQQTGRIYYVGRDLQNYCNLTPQVDSDFMQVLQTGLDHMTKHPVEVTVEQTRAAQQEAQAQQQQVNVPDLPEVNISSEVDLSSTATLQSQVSVAEPSSASQLVESQAPVESDLLESSEVEPATSMNFNDLLKQLNQQRQQQSAQQAGPRVHHAYVDDFADALSESNSASSQRSQVRKIQRVESNINVESIKPDKPKQQDDGLAR